MSTEYELHQLARRFCKSEISFNDLAFWVQDREEYWLSLPREDPHRALAGRIMLSAFEVWAHHRDEDSARDSIAEAMLDPAP
jgi:hypothetical protein